LEGLSKAAGPTPLLVKADGVEIGLRSDLVQRLHVQVAVFDIRLRSELVYDQDQGEDQPGPPSDRHGVQVSAQYRPTPWLELNSDLSFSRARFVGVSPKALLADYGDNGDHIPNAPGFIGSFGAIFDHLGPWSGGLEVRALGAFPLTPDNSQRDAGYTETNLDFGYRARPSLKIRLDVFNLFDVKANAGAYFYTTVIPDGRGPTADHQVHPLEPLSARLSFETAF
jgi:outer membrane receptor protein involved in Fe transport